MCTASEGNPVREAVAVFDSADSLEGAIDALLRNGFDRSELSLLASEDVVKDKLGHAYTRVEDLEDDPSAPTAAYISTGSISEAEGALIGAPMYVAAATAAGVTTAVGGPLAAIITAGAVAAGAGAAIGGVLASMVGQHHANYLQKQLDHGGLLLWVRTFTEADERKATDILTKHSGRDVHVHG